MKPYGKSRWLWKSWRITVFIYTNILYYIITLYDIHQVKFIFTVLKSTAPSMLKVKSVLVIESVQQLLVLSRLQSSQQILHLLLLLKNAIK